MKIEPSFQRWMPWLGNVFGVALLTGAVTLQSVTPARESQAPSARPLKLEQLTREQVKALGDDERVEFKGKVTTKRELRAHAEEKARQARATTAAAATAADSKFKAEAARVLAEHDANVRKQMTDMRSQAAKRWPKPPAPNAGPPGGGSSPRGGGTPRGGGPQVDPCKNKGPKITGQLGIYTPGGGAFISGECFGSAEGQVYLNLIPVLQSRQLTVVSWSASLVEVAIQNDVGGVLDQTGHIQLWRKEQYPSGSNSVDVPFKAKRVAASLDPNAASYSCSSEADIDVCTRIGGIFYATHTTSIDPLGEDTGHDTITMSLKNGWVFTTLDVKPAGYPYTDGSVTPSGFVFKATTLNLKLNWKTGCGWDCSTGYMTTIFVNGPQGLPYK